MKITIGGTKKFTLMPRQYQPVAAESTIFIEQEYDDDADIDEIMEVMNDKINAYLEKDLKVKIKQTIQHQTECR